MSRKHTILIVIVTFAIMLPVVISFTTELSLGDEVYHYRLAKNFYLSGKRPVKDILYQDSERSEVIYTHDIFWHFMLTAVWKTFGRISFTLAQIYHTSYYFLLIFLTYLLGKELYGKEVGIYSAVLVATVPMVAAFGILFYTDIPSVVFAVLCILLMIKKKYLWAGVSLGMIYLAKRNGLLFIPAIILIVFYDQVSLKVKLRNLLIIFAVAGVIIFPDILWRKQAFKEMPPSIWSSVTKIMHRAATPMTKIMKRAHPASTAPTASTPTASAPTGDVASFANLAAGDYPFLKYFKDYLFLSYFGVTLILCLIMYFFHKYKWFKKQDIILWTLIMSYILLYLCFLGLCKEMRYLMPTVPFAAVLGSRSIVSMHKKYIKIIIIIVCAIQLFVTVFYVSMKRQIPKGLNDSFTYIKENTPPDAEILYLGYICLERAERMIRWGNNEIFWSTDATKTLSAINNKGIDYIMIRNSMVYDDKNIRFVGGYPKSFVERLRTFSFVRLIYENNESSVWKVTGNNE